MSHSNVEIPSPKAPARQRRLLVKGIAGLGNRILCLLTACLYADLNNRRVVVDWRDPIFTGRSGTAPDLFTELFNSPLVDPLPETLESASVAPTLWQDRLNETVGVVGREQDPVFYKRFSSFRKLGVSLNRRIYDEDLLVFWSWREVLRPLRRQLRETDQRYHFMSNTSILREAANRFLQPNERVLSHVHEFTRRNFRGRMLGLHIRATDLRAPVDKLLRVALSLCRKHHFDGVFCATDNADAEERAKQLLPNVCTTTKQFPRAALPMHYDPDCENRSERATQALVDMLLLAECDHLVYASRSSFAYVANIFASDNQRVTDIDRFHPAFAMKRFVQSWIY